MQQVAQERLERRVLILAPIGKDAALIASILEKEDIPGLICPDIACLVQELERGAGAMLVEEEALAAGDGGLAAALARQSSWSDFPVLLLARPGHDSPTVIWSLESLGNVALLERPVRVAALVSAVRTALRARERQYQTRAHLQERERADRRKDEFLATLAHELRNPLAPIRNSVNMLRLSGIGQPADAALEMMDRQIDHMVRLVDDLTEVSRITRGTIELRREPVDLNSVIHSAVETARPLLDAAGHTLDLRLAPEALVVVGDPVRLAQVFSNLINNAVKYTDPGGHITVTVQADGAHAVVTVADTGIGISAESLPIVFDMFIQASEHKGRGKSGLGIGLTLVRSLVQMHGGEVSARSAGLGRGSEFTVRLPRAETKIAEARRGMAPGKAIKGVPRVLVLDDNPDAADSLGAVLEMLGAEVRVAHDGRAALEEVKRFHPAAVFLDLGMPGMDGYEVASRLRSRTDRQNLRLIAVTGWGQEKDRLQTAAAGFDHHLVKPADITALRSVLASLTSTHRL